MNILNSRKVLFLASIMISIVGAYLLVSLLDSGLEIPVSIGLSTIIIIFFQFSFFSRINNKVDDNYAQVESLLSIFNFLDLNQPIPPLRGSVVSPDFAKIVISKIIREKPSRILELGSGVSSLLSAYTLEKLGGGLIFSLDHEEKYADISSEMIQQHGLERFAKIVYSPLQDIILRNKNWKYYDSSCLAKEDNFDMLVVDGPPAIDSPLARYPALPVFFDKLVPGAIIIVDDANRPGERESVDCWLQQYPVVEIYSWPAEKGIRVLKKI